MSSGSPTTPSASQRRFRTVIIPPLESLAVSAPVVRRLLLHRRRHLRGSGSLPGRTCVRATTGGRRRGHARRHHSGLCRAGRDQSDGKQASAVGFVTLNEVAPVLAIWPPAAPPKATQYSAPPLTRRTTLAPVPGFGGTTRTSGCSPGPSLPWIFTLSWNVPLAVFESCASLTCPLRPLLST